MKPHLPRIVRGGKTNTEKKTPKLSGIDFNRAGLAIVTTVVLSLLLSISSNLLPSKITLKLGEASPEDVIAHRTCRYMDTAETELRRAQAAASVGREYDAVPNAANQAIGAWKTIFHTIDGVRSNASHLPLSDRVQRVREQLGTFIGDQISDETLALMLSSHTNTLRQIKEDSLRIISAAMGREIRDEPAEIRAARKAVMEQAHELIDRDSVANAVGEVAQEAVRPNQIYNEARTIAKQEKARESVKPVYRLILAGEKVIAKDEQVLQEHIDKFDALGLRNPTFDYRSMVALTLFVIGAVMLVSMYLARYHEDVYSNTKTLWLLALIVMFSAFALKVGGSMLGISLKPSQVGHLGILWILTASMLISVLLKAQIAVVIASLLSLVLSLFLNNELKYATGAMVMSLVGIYSVANIRDRGDLVRAAGTLAITGILLVWIMGGITNDSLSEMLQGSVWALVTAAVAAWLLFPFGTMLLERPFQQTTHMSLLELADTNRKLLRQLVMEAPGTYTHSMAVGHLAETAAEAIGADSLVARVGSYYHDIGKIRRPHFFIENQHIENVHDRMNPTLSALVITSHIKDGVDVAKEHRLPKVVVDIITQHHGTSLVQYFYSQAATEQDPSTALEQQFRYQGPKPQSKEAAIVMLADSVEAASRCLDKPTPAKIELLINRVIAEKLRDGQLDESELTFREVSTIAASFVRTLIGTMHARIEYPEAPGAEVKKVSENANSDSEFPGNAGGPGPDSEPDSAAAAG